MGVTMTVTGPLLLLLCVTGCLTAAVLPEDRDVGIDISINIEKVGRVTKRVPKSYGGLPTWWLKQRYRKRHRGLLIDDDLGDDGLGEAAGSMEGLGEAAGPMGGEEGDAGSTGVPSSSCVDKNPKTCPEYAKKNYCNLNNGEVAVKIKGVETLITKYCPK